MAQSNRLHRAITRRLGKHLARLWPGEISRPVFVVGCPRSGTTILGRVLASCPGLFYMHEPRYIWRDVNPELNVWRGHAAIGVLRWDATGVDPAERTRLARWFHLALVLGGGRRRLVEKMPLNVFRLRWLAAMFPDAQFIHVIRHGRDVALSMQEAVGRWFSGERGYPDGYWASSWHYRMFADFSRQVPALGRMADLADTHGDDYARCLLVWLCCVWEGLEAEADLGGGRLLRVRYEHLVRDPASELRTVFEFLGGVDRGAPLAYARTVLHAGSLHKPDPDPGATHAIAGEMLARLGYPE